MRYDGAVGSIVYTYLIYFLLSLSLLLTTLPLLFKKLKIYFTRPFTCPIISSIIN